MGKIGVKCLKILEIDLLCQQMVNTFQHLLLVYQYLFTYQQHLIVYYPQIYLLLTVINYQIHPQQVPLLLPEELVLVVMYLLVEIYGLVQFT
jgi:hypothetical protein